MSKTFCTVLSSTMLLFLFSCSARTQSPVQYVPLERVAVLHKKLVETSGLASAHDRTLYVHNDGGKKSELYEISMATGEITRTIEVDNARNKDWEELTEDEDYIYIGDCGNNAGNRDDLRVLKLSKNDIARDAKVDVGKIHFTYPDQGSLKARGKHDFDCEAMIAVGDSLYLFSKNRETRTTNVYRLPKTPGEYVAEKISSFNTDGLITAADILPGKRRSQLVLLGYEQKGGRYVSFLWLFKDFRGTDFFSGTSEKLAVSPNLQAEAVLWESDTTILITNEEQRAGRGQLSRIDLKQYLK